jgi:hypothetical protein
MLGGPILDDNPMTAVYLEPFDFKKDRTQSESWREKSISHEKDTRKNRSWQVCERHTGVNAGYMSLLKRVLALPVAAVEVVPLVAGAAPVVVRSPVVGLCARWFSM